MLEDYDRIEKAIGYIVGHVNSQPSLDDVAEHLNLSPWHFQRLFRRWAGISPKRFLQIQTLEHAKNMLKQSRSVMETTNALGLGSSSRLHDHFVTLEAVTPGEFKTGGRGLDMYWGIHITPFGRALIAVSDRGISHLSFIDEQTQDSCIQEIAENWPNARLTHASKNTASYVQKIFSRQDITGNTIPLFVQGTNFQVNVWRALLRIPPGCLMTYGQLSEMIGKPGSARAVGTAVATNPVAFLIPCHRVIRASGVIGNYRWGSIRKRAILGWETTGTGNQPIE